MSALVRRTLPRKLNFCSRWFQPLRRTYHSEEGAYGYKPKKGGRPFDVPGDVLRNRQNNANVYRLVTAYRDHGHKKAVTDPLNIKGVEDVPELGLAWYGFSSDATQSVDLEGIYHGHRGSMEIGELVKKLEQTYCGPMALETQHIQELEEREWLIEQYESMRMEKVDDTLLVRTAKLMLKSQAFDHFLGSKFASVKRYGGEGGESAMGFYDELFRVAANGDISDVIICIAHRGRLNLLTSLLNFPPNVMFRKMKGLREFPPNVAGCGDVLSHLTSSVDLDYDGNKVHVTMVPNPSHLEAVNPVAVGKTRARMQSLQAGEYAPEGHHGEPGDKVLCFQIHGDGAFSAQGIVPETFCLANLPHFSVGGSIHLILNNQLGFTTPGERGRSSRYASDTGKVISCPVIRVNADYPEEVIKSCRLAMAYREKFRKDIVIDFVCFRKWGHNELDEPSFTNPLMYKAIRSRQSIPDNYAEQLVGHGVCTKEELSSSVQEWVAELNANLERVESCVPQANHLEKQWSGFVQAPSTISSWNTGLSPDLLKFVGAHSVNVPEHVVPHKTLAKGHIDRRLKALQADGELDWATAEALALGSLMYQGYNVRLSGQDVGRGTFSQRHGMLVDQEGDHLTIPLNHMIPEQKGFLEIANSALSEEAVLGFEYGMSIENPNILAIWEAQFGDFFNGAQIIIDTFVTCGETKWLLQSGMVLLLPHGMDGAGPEHSSCRVERFLQLTDSSETQVDGDNLNVQFVNPTTPAQYFHLLRRQMVRNFRKPLVVAAPKMLLRHPSCMSRLKDMADGTHFLPVLAETGVSPLSVKKVVFTSGKHYYALKNHRDAAKITDTALVRVEQLCPFPAADIRDELKKYSNAVDFVWSQEEHRNMGPWTFIAPRFENVVGKKLRYVGRGVSPIAAAGVGEVHKQEAAQLLTDTFS